MSDDAICKDELDTCIGFMLASQRRFSIPVKRN